MVTATSARSIEWTQMARAAGRASLSIIFLYSGVEKVLAPAATMAEIDSVGLPLPSLAYALSVGVELLCGGALLAGYRLRWAAGMLAAFTLATAIFFHSTFADPNQLTHFLKNVAITGGLLYVMTMGNERKALSWRVS